MRRLASFIVVVLLANTTRAHDETSEAAKRRQREVERRALAQADTAAAKLPGDETARVTLKLVDDKSGAPLPALVRITNVGDDKAIQPAGEIHRAANWFSLAAETTLRLPRRKLRVEAIHGLETERTVEEIDLTAGTTTTVALRLRRFADARTDGLRAGNTHLHLRGFSFAEMDRYLRLVPQTDGLDVVFVSHLRRVPDERDYITNILTAGDLGRLSESGVLFGNGEEHRHNFGPGAEGYGHVMFLNIQKLIEPVSIGPGIMRSGTDGRPLRTGIDEARRQGATVLWCHNRFGLEDVPSWLANVIDAQNIFDGGLHGSYDETYYRYLNLGMHVPFSTGTDWFMYDFSRVYVAMDQKLTPAGWLKQLAAGRTKITNGPLLELSVDAGPRGVQTIGDVLKLDQPRTVKVRGRGRGRLDFRGIELLFNGRVVRAEPARAVGGHHEAALDAGLDLSEPGWLALRIPLEQEKNELDQTLFAHTSPIYVELGGRRIFRRDVAETLLQEMRWALEFIRQHGAFANAAERERVLDVYREGIRTLETRLSAQRETGGSAAEGAAGA